MSGVRRRLHHSENFAGCPIFRAFCEKWGSWLIGCSTQNRGNVPSVAAFTEDLSEACDLGQEEETSSHAPLNFGRALRLAKTREAGTLMRWL